MIKLAAGNKHKKRYFAAFACVIAVAGAKYVFDYVINYKYLIDVPYISQEGSAATGCELVSTAMVLDYYGCDASVEDVINRTPASGLTQTQNGLVGDSPSEYFIGDPRSSHGFGCYAPVVVSVMNSFFEGQKSKKAVDLTGCGIDELISLYIEKDNPVLIWATSNMKEPKKGDTWILKNTGGTFQWISGEHCLVLVGYDKNNYYFNDPYASNGIIPFEKGLVAERYGALGKQAVAVQDAA